MSPLLDSGRNPKRAKALFEFTQGIDVDARLAQQEIRVQKAWAKAIAQIGVLSPSEQSQVQDALTEASQLMIDNRFAWRIEDEDVHMNLERFVTERCGVLGKKMHLGRSRNDLIATTLKLFTAECCDRVCALTQDLARSLCDQGTAQIDVIIPGMTHMQHGQPVRMGHIFAAHAQALTRDLKRLDQAKQSAMAQMPLGSAALAGTPLDVDLAMLAQDLGFSSPPSNSYDAVGDRDFILETTDAFAQLAVHLSRLAEDCIYWSSSAIGLIRLPTEWSTGSSIMPNKRNPDVPELVRGKSGHILGAQAGAHALLKGLPTSYDSDLHELKALFLNAFDSIELSLNAFVPFMQTLTVDISRAKALANHGHILATEIADTLASHGIPFREAYGQVASLVEHAESRGVQVHELPPEVYSVVAPALSSSAIQSIGFLSAVERRNNLGGTSRSQVASQLLSLRQKINASLH